MRIDEFAYSSIGDSPTRSDLVCLACFGFDLQSIAIRTLCIIEDPAITSVYTQNARQFISEQLDREFTYSQNGRDFIYIDPYYCNK